MKSDATIILFAAFAAVLPEAISIALPLPLTVSEANVCSNAEDCPFAAAGMDSVPGPLAVPSVNVASEFIGVLLATVAVASAEPHWNTASVPPTTTAETFSDPVVAVVWIIVPSRTSYVPSNSGWA